MTGLLEIPDGSVDLVFADLPYQMTRNRWDSLLPLPELWNHYRRLLTPNGAIVLTASQPFTSALVESNREQFRCEWIWRKNTATGHLNAKRYPLRSHESVLVFGESGLTYNPQGLVRFEKMTRRGSNGTNYGQSGTENFQQFTNYPRSIVEFDSDPERQHPTQKPVALVEYFIRTYSSPGAVVLDNTMGSGSTGVAAIRAGRDFVGFEQDPGYFDIAVDRIRGAGVEPVIRDVRPRFTDVSLLFEVAA